MKNETIRSIYRDLCWDYFLIGSDLYDGKDKEKVDFPIFPHDHFILRFRNEK